MEEYRKSAKPWAMLVACCIVDAIGLTVPVTMFSVFLTPIRNELGLTMLEAQSYNVAMMLMTIASTALGSRILNAGAGKVIAAASGAIMLGYWLLGLHPCLATLVFAGLMGGFYPLLSIYTMPVVIGSWFYKNQGTWISVCIAMSGIGGLVMSPVATSLIASLGWQTAALVASSAMIVPLLLGATFIRINPLDQHILPHGATENEIAQLSATSSHDHRTPQMKEANKRVRTMMPGASFAKALKSPGFVFLAIVMFSTGFQSAYATNLNPLVQSAGYSAELAALALSASSLGNLVGKPVWGIMRDRFGAVLAGGVAFGTMAVGLCLYLVGMAVYNEPAMIVAALIGGLGGTAGLNMPSLYTKDAFGARDFDRIYSAQMGIRSVGATVVYPLVGIMFDATGSYRLMVIVLVVAALVTIPAGYGAVHEGRKLWLPHARTVGRPVDVAADGKESA